MKQPTVSHCLRYVGAALLGMAAFGAQADSYVRGPDPTSANLNATAGSFAVTSVSISGQSGFGGGTIYYPTEANTYGVIALCPGFISTQIAVGWLAKRLATYGFVVVAMNTNSIFDFPDSRATQIAAALKYVVNSSGTAVKSRIDPSRLAVGGHSMGGGGALTAVKNNAALKAAFPMAPYNLVANYTTVTVPTMVITGSADVVAPSAGYGHAYYNNIPNTTFKAYGELNGATHTTPTTTNTPIGRYAVSWMKRFVDGDTRYSEFLCGASHTAYATSSVFSAYQQNCPY